jgi:phosphoglycolate phosphatase
VSKPRILVFDFDGTLADTAPLIRKIYSELAVKNGWQAITDKDYDQLRKGTLDEARRWAGIRVWQLPLVAKSAKSLMTMESEKVTLFPGISALINDLREQDYKLYILSRNSVETIERVLERTKHDDDLTILSLRRFPFGSKTEVLKRLLRQKKYQRDDVIMIGDEVRDIQAAKNAGIASIAVSWGLQHESILERFEPTYLVHTVDELKDIL